MKKLSLFAIALLFLTGAGCQADSTAKTQKTETTSATIETSVPLSETETSVSVPSSNGIETSVIIQ